ncbi:MAG TPA: GntR family transcriptional regulator [Pelomicrobium sp.]|nr:GntR family transcriptional regulator [Pelomicrobium sp.]
MITRLEVQPDLVQQVYNALLEAICSGQLTEGQRVTQEEIAEQLAVSRQPVVQAFAMLRREGFLTEAGRKGVMVSPLDPDSLTHLYQIRASLDGLAAELAAQNPKRGSLDAALIDRGRAAVAAGDVGAMVDADVAFHHRIYELSGNPLIEETLAQQWKHLRRYMGGVLEESGAREGIWDEHAAIFEAVKNGRPQDAGARAREHALNGAERLVERIRHRSDLKEEAR